MPPPRTGPVYHEVMERHQRHRLLRRLSSLLLVVGGVVLAYPFWSAGYASIQQGRLGHALSRSQVTFDAVIRAERAALAQLSRPEDRAARLAGLFEVKLRPGQAIGRIRIPRIGLDRVVLEGVRLPPSFDGLYNQAFLRDGPTHYGTTPLPGEGRPFAVAGHRTTYGAPFYRLNQLSPGDGIFVTTPYGVFEYRVAKVTAVSPDDVSVLYDRGYDLVLTTCHPPYRAAKRLVVWADLSGLTVRGNR